MLHKAARRRLRAEAFRLARETYERDVTDERLLAIEARLTVIDAQLYPPLPSVGQLVAVAA